MTDRRTDGLTDGRTDRPTGKNNMSLNPVGGRHKYKKKIVYYKMQKVFLHLMLKCLLHMENTETLVLIVLMSQSTIFQSR